MRRRVLALALVALAAAPTAAHGAGSQAGEISPQTRTTGNGRKLSPQGKLTGVGNFPTGSALTPDGRFAWIVDSGHGHDDVQVVDVASGQVKQVLNLPGAYGGVAISPDGRRAWVSGTPAGDTLAGPVQGSEGDVLHVYAIDPATGAATETTPIPLPSSCCGTGQVNSLPPVSALYPAGIAVSRDGRTVAVAEQQADRVALLDVGTGAIRTVQVGAYPTTVAFDRRGRAWVANLYDGTLSVVDPASGSVVDTVRGLGGERGDRNSHPAGMALDPVDDRLYVAVSQRDLVAVVDTAKRRVVRRVSVARPTGPLGVSPVDVAVDRDDVYVADANEDTVAVIARRARPAKAGLPAKRRLVQPVPTVKRLARYVRAVRREDRRHRAAARRLGHGAAAKREARRHVRALKRLRHGVNLARRQACGGPSRTQGRRARARILAALRAGRTARARRLAKRLPKLRACRAAPGYLAGAGQYDLLGKIRTAAYPDAVEALGDGKLLWVAGKGFGTGANPQYSFDQGQVAGGTITTPVYGQYVLDALNGVVGRTSRLRDTSVRKGNAAALAQAEPTNATEPPAGTPVRPGGPIQHVFLIVRENRTYDQVLGSDPRGDGDPGLELFDDNGVAGPTGGVTPNAHALTRRFPLLDHVYSDSEVSVDGHLITTGGFANDYVQQATAQNYSRPGKSYDFGIAPVTFGPNDFLFDQAVRQSVPFTNYGEEAAGILPMGADGRETYSQVVASSNVAYPGPAQIGCAAPLGQGGDLASCFQDSGKVGLTGTVTAAVSRVDVFAAQFGAQQAAGNVPAFNYLVLPNDHTNGTTPGAYSPKALIADNDLALGQLVQLISHSSVWGSSAILVEEDDSQDGADHVDAHRQPAFVISPWAKGGVEVPTRYDQYSVMATVERILGLHPLSTNDALAVPMYDAFVTGGTAPNTAPYDAIRPQQPLGEVNGQSAPLAALSRSMPYTDLDLVPQAVSDAVLYASVHGSLDGFGGPGPGASGEEHARAIGALRAVTTGHDARRWLVRHGGEADDEDEDEEAGAHAAPRRAPLDAATAARAAAQARGTLAAIGR